MEAALSLETDRLLLRQFEEGDFAAVHRYASDPETTRYVNFGPNSEDETRQFLQLRLKEQRVEPRADYVFAIVLKATEELIGSCGIHSVPGKQAERSIGYILARECWGQDYMTDAVRALITFGFQRLSLHRITATCDPKNVASYRVMEKAGMRREGYLRQDRWQKGAWRDSFVYAILEEEWERDR